MSKSEPREGIQHLQARRIVQFYLETKGRVRSEGNFINFRTEFINEHKLGKRFPGHSYDIVTQDEVIEIDDLEAHSKNIHKINDQLAERYIKEYHTEYNFYRLLKEEIVNRRGWIQPDCYQYLRAHLF